MRVANDGVAVAWMCARCPLHRRDEKLKDMKVSCCVCHVRNCCVCRLYCAVSVLTGVM